VPDSTLNKPVPPRRQQVAIPMPGHDVAALVAVCMALKEAVEVLAGQRGDPLDRAVTFRTINEYLEKRGVPMTAPEPVAGPHVGAHRIRRPE
jgi:hypothetical protein